jgi:endo-1,4-beta-xylanase
MRSRLAWLIALVLLVGSAQAADAAEIARYGFEGGTVQGWQPRGDGVSLAVSEGQAHSGQASLLVTGRSANWQGAAITGPFEQGVSYRVSAWVRQVSGSSTLALTVQRTTADGTTVFERVAAATADGSGWTELSGAYSYTGDSSGITLYAESSDATAAYHLDDIVIAADTDPTTSGLTSDFESGAQGWASRASATVGVTTEQAHGGTRSLSVTGRTASWDGPHRTILGTMAKGSKYTLEVWVRLGPGVASGNLGLSIERRLNGTPSYERVVSPKAVPAGEWVQLKGTYMLAYDVDFLSVYLESDSGTFPFYLDDFALTYIAPTPIQANIPAVKDTTPFAVGAAIQRAQTLGEHSKLLNKHFSSVTPGNDLKWDATEPTEGQFTFTEADHLVGYATQHGLKVRGHTLVWHQQTPAWVFKDGDRDLEATPEDKALLLNRLENHIRAVAGRYRGKLHAWDVVNEVIDENQADGLRRSRWFEITGLDYLRTAFRVAREVDPTAKLYINDYNTEFPDKRAALHAVVQRLLAEGVPIDGVGHQLHLKISEPPATEVEKTLTQFAGLGLDQQVTELDVSVYPDDTSSWPTIPPEVLDQQGHRYRQLFEVFRKHAALLDSVTLWGLADDDTWLSTFPITRLNAPLLFDVNLQAKPAYWAVVDPHFSGAAPAAGPAGCTVRYSLSDQWAGNFRAQVTLTNTSAADVSRWQLTWSYGNGQKVTTAWDATPGQYGSVVSIKHPSWKPGLPAGKSATFGVLGLWSGANPAPNAFTLNGTPCTPLA